MLRNFSWRKNYYFRFILKQKMSTTGNPVELTIRKKLTEGLKPSHLEIINESHRHNVPKGSETHFKVVVVSDVFKDISLIKRHRLVFDLLKSELESNIHALSIVAKTPFQWNENGRVSPSPNCLGGFGK